MWYTMFWVLLCAGAIMLIAGIVLFLVLDASSALSELSGKRRRERIRKLERANQSSDGPATADLYNLNSGTLDDALEDIEVEGEDEGGGLRGRLGRVRGFGGGGSGSDSRDLYPTGGSHRASEDLDRVPSVEIPSINEDNLATGQANPVSVSAESEEFGTGVWESGYADDLVKTPFSADRSVAVVFERSSVV